MEVKIGFRENAERNAKLIVYADTQTCYLRNFADYDNFLLANSPIEFLNNLALTLSHEDLHLILNNYISEEACHNLNHIDGFSGYLVERTRICRGCNKQIRTTHYVIHGGFHWHKQCLDKYHKEKCIICNNEGKL